MKDDFRTIAIGVVGICGLVLGALQGEVLIGLVVMFLSLIALELQEINNKLTSKDGSETKTIDVNEKVRSVISKPES